MSAHRTQPPTRLVVTADDFGLGLATSRGIIDAHLRGPVSATSLMTVTGDHARASVELLSRAPRLQVGLHLVFTDVGHRPLAASVSGGLTTRDGGPLSLSRLWQRAFTGQLDRAAVVAEIAAQTRHFTALIGRPPAFVDGHHHAHQLPVIRHALIEAVTAGVLPPVTRVTTEPSAIRAQVRHTRLKRWVAHTLGLCAAATFAHRGLVTNSGFIGMISPGDLARPFPWATFFDHLPTHGAGLIEWVVHPGHDDPTIDGRDAYRHERLAELAALTDPRHQHYWARFGPPTTKLPSPPPLPRQSLSTTTSNRLLR